MQMSNAPAQQFIFKKIQKNYQKIKFNYFNIF